MHDFWKELCESYFKQDISQVTSCQTNMKISLHCKQKIHTFIDNIKMKNVNYACLYIHPNRYSMTYSFRKIKYNS